MLFLSGKGAPANRPGTSKHELGLAVDVGVNDGKNRAKDEADRAHYARQLDLLQPFKVEPWHLEKSPGSSLFIPAQAPNIAVTTIGVDLPRYADKYTWPDGTSVQVFPDGAVKNYGSKHWGSMHSFRPECKQTFTKAESVRPIDPNNSAAGYIIGNENGDEWACNEDARRRFYLPGR